jgi:oxygen-independent coproporphyrinogen-3 oxidase
MDHYALSADSLAVAAREQRLHRNFQGYTTGGEIDLLGVGPTAISQFPQLFSQNQRDLVAMQTSAKDVRQRFDQHDAVVVTIGGGEGAVAQR